MKSMTKQEKARLYRKIEATANNWLAQGLSKEIVVNGLWNKFGHSVEIKNGQILVYADKQIVVTIN